MAPEPKPDPGAQAAKDQLRAAKEAEAAAASRPPKPAATPAPAPSAAAAGSPGAAKTATTAGKAATTPAGVRAMVSSMGVTGLWAANSRAGKGIMDRATGLLGKAGKHGATAAKFARFVPGVGMAASAYLAYSNFRDGDVVGGLLNVVGALPPPAGWVGLGASLAYETFFDQGGVEMWDAPDGSATHLLPGSAKDIEGVTDADAQLRRAQQQVFNYADGPTAEVWKAAPPKPLRLHTETVSKAATAWLGTVSQLFSDITRELQQSGEPYAIEYGTRLAAHSAAMKSMADVPAMLAAQLGDASTAAAAAYTAVTAANEALRQQLSEDGSLSDRASLDAADRALTSADSQVDRAAAGITQLVPAEPAPALVAAGPAAGATAPAPAAPSPMPGVPAPGPGAPLSPGTAAPKADEKSDLAELLKTLGKGGMPAMPTVPSMGGGNPLGGGSPLGGGMGGGSPLGQNGGRKLDDRERKPLEEKTERKLSSATPDNRTAAVPTPAAAAAPAGAPVTKPGDAAVKPGDPAAPKPNTEVDVKGTKVDFGDPKLAKLAQLLANATPQAPMSLADAAAQAGLTPPTPGQDPGQQVSPANATPGDVLVVGDKSYMLLGEGRFLDLAEYKTIGASELPADAGTRGGYFHLGDPADPSAAGGGAPVSAPPTGGVAQDVPGGAPTPTVPADASPAPTAPTPAVPAGTGAVPSTGTPGVPAAGSGNGPTNANATATGTGVPAPSTSAAPLDPGAVR